MPFRDRADAGKSLALKLTAYANRSDVVVVALPRGGVPVAFEVARALHAPLYVIVVRRLEASADGEVTIGAVGDGVVVIDEALVKALGLSDTAVQEAVQREQREIARRESLYADYRISDLAGRTVIIVDDGVATGSSMGAAVAVIEARRPSGIVVAVPVDSDVAYVKPASRLQEDVYLYARNPVYPISLWYEDYRPVTDEEACKLLREARMRDQAVKFSPEHYRELAADPTANREQAFEQRGFPARGPR